VVITRSFARIHEANLKKQGVLPLTLADPATYDLIDQDDRISILGLAELTPDVPVACRITKSDGTAIDFQAIHTMNEEQIGWFRAGGALNIIRQKQGV
jgi:aconitate hydratase